MIYCKVEPAMSPLNEPSGTETILVVDDEAAVLSIASAFLVRRGYDILQATSGAQALEICKQRNSGIQLLVTDVTMPGMTGPQLAECLHLLYPEMRVLYMSGYGDYEFEQNRSFPMKWFLRKPFTSDALATLVRQALDEPRKREPGRQLSDSETRKAVG